MRHPQHHQRQNHDRQNPNRPSSGGGFSGRFGGRFGNWLAPPRFLVFITLLPLTYFAYRWQLPTAEWKDALAMAFDVAAAVFLASLVPLLGDSDANAMRRHARDNDANRVLLLLFTSLLTVVVMAAISGELTGAKAGDALAIAKLVLTLALIWLFAQIVYALHYAHMYYSEPATGGDKGGIIFPGTTTPTYSDFCYFSFTLGMTFQTSDVQITRRAVRQIVMLHTFAGFIFNIGIIAFTINALSG